MKETNICTVISSRGGHGQRCKNSQMCKQCSCKINYISGKIFAKFTMFFRESECCRDITLFGGIFSQILEIYVTFCQFFFVLHFLGLSGLLCCFVVNLMCHNLRTFWVKYFWLKPSCLFACLAMGGRAQTNKVRPTSHIT